MSKPTATRRWPDILIGVLVLLLLAGFAALLLGQRRPATTAATPGTSVTTPANNVTTPATPAIPAAPGTPDETSGSAAPQDTVTTQDAVTPQDTAPAGDTATPVITPPADSAVTPPASGQTAPDQTAADQTAPDQTIEAPIIPAAPTATTPSADSSADAVTGTDNPALEAQIPGTTVPQVQTPTTQTPATQAPADQTPADQTPQTTITEPSTDQTTPDQTAQTAPPVPRSGGAVATSESRMPLRSDYRISLGTFGSVGAARRRTEPVSSLGYTVYPIEVGSQVVAQVGPFADAAAARQALSDIQRTSPGALLYAPRNPPSPSDSESTASPAPASAASDTATDAAPAAAPSGPVYLQVGAFDRVESAQTLVQQLRDLGYVPTVNAPEGRKVTVAVGPYTGDALTRTETRLDANDLDHFRVR